MLCNISGFRSPVLNKLPGSKYCAGGKSMFNGYTEEFKKNAVAVVKPKYPLNVKH